MSGLCNKTIKYIRFIVIQRVSVCVVETVTMILCQAEMADCCTDTHTADEGFKIVFLDLNQKCAMIVLKFAQNYISVYDVTIDDQSIIGH